MTIEVHLDGLTLSVANVRRSMKFYGETLGFKIVVDAAPDFALVRVGGKGGGTIGLLALRHAVGGKATPRGEGPHRPCRSRTGRANASRWPWPPYRRPR